MLRLISLFLVLTAFNSIATDYDYVGELNKKRLVLNRRKKFPAGVNLYLMGPVGVAALSFDYFITPKLNLEVGGGFRNFDGDIGYTFGGKYHFFGKTSTNITPYIGVYSGFEYTGTTLRNYNLFIPVGLHRIKRNRFSWSIEAAYQHNSYALEQRFYGGVKLGFRFGFVKKGLFRK